MNIFARITKIDVGKAGTGEPMRKGQNPHEHREDGVTAIQVYWKGKVMECLVSTEDYSKVKDFHWHAHRHRGTFYARTNSRKSDGTRTTLGIHRLLLRGAPKIDHVRGDGLDNTRPNLRSVTGAQNNANMRHPRIGKTSRFKGVSMKQSSQKWCAQIQVNGKVVFLGYFTSEEAAARAYNAAALEHFGEFAALNLLPPPPVTRKPGEFIPRSTAEMEGHSEFICSDNENRCL
jgi:hypothetical protein